MKSIINKKWIYGLLGTTLTLSVHGKPFEYFYLNEEKVAIPVKNDAVVAVGIGLHRIKGGSAQGLYVSGIAPISDSSFGVYGRGELISDMYKTGHFWSMNTAIGAGYYANSNVILIASVGKCFSNYSTCYFNSRQADVNDDDIDAIYFGFGTFIKEPFYKNYIELTADWSPYKNYNGSSLYIGYGFRF